MGAWRRRWALLATLWQRDAKPLPAPTERVAAMSPWQIRNLATIRQRLAPVLQARPGILFERQSPYNHIVVRRTAEQLLLCYRHRRHHLEEIQSRLSVAEPVALKSEYTQAMVLALAWQPAPQRVLSIGLGGGRLQTVLHHYLETTTFTTIELDPAVIEVAQRFFGFTTDERQHVVVADGRTALRNTASTAPFDLMFLDAYQVSGVPSHLSTREFYEECCARLAPSGVVAANLQSGALVHEAEHKTFVSAFRFTTTITLLSGNVVVIGSNTEGPDPATLRARAVAVQQRYGFDFALPEWADAAALPAPEQTKAEILRDAALAREQ